MSERELDAVIAAIEERDRLRQELAAAKALLRDCLPELDGEGTTIHRVWAALAGKDEK